MIDVKNLTKIYGNAKVVDNLNFSIQEGETIGFLGPNGAGKSTTMKMLTGIVPPTFGEAIINGFNTHENPLAVKSIIGYLPENVPLYDFMNVISYLSFVAQVKGFFSRQVKTEVDKVVSECGLVEVEKKKISQLSKGYRQRVGLAQALIGTPKLIILDEPTVGLDPRQIIEIRNLIKTLATKCTIIISSHILPEIELICNRVIMINKGKIVTTDTTENLRKRLQPYNKLKIDMKTSDANDYIMSELKKIEGVISIAQETCYENGKKSYDIDTRDDDSICNKITELSLKKHWVLMGINQQKISLEEIFIELMTTEEQEK